MTIVNGKTFWESMWTSAEKDGDSIRIGSYRSALVNDAWGVMKDGAEYPTGKKFDTHQEAIDWMVFVHLVGEELADDSDAY